MGELIVGALIFLAGFITGAFVFRKNPVIGEKVAAKLEEKFDELAAKVNK